MPVSDQLRAEALLDEGRAHLDKGKIKQAESCFRAAAAISDNPAARNNWALCLHLTGKHTEALEILGPVLAGPTPVPFARALACQIFIALGQREAATREVHTAIRDLDSGLASMQRQRMLPDPGWVAYTVPVKKAAGELGLDRLVLELHGRWPGRELPDGAFAAGVAAFNLGRFAQAAKYWRQIAAPGWARAMSAYITTADLAEAGLVPSFRLEYSPDSKEEEALRAAGNLEALSALGTVRVRMLALLFLPEAEDKGTIVGGLIGATGPWGVDLGRRLLAGSAVPMDIKSAAARALTEVGVFAEDEPIPIIHQGKATQIIIQRMEIQGDDPEAEAVFQEAKRLRDAGKPDDAMRLLSGLIEKGIAYPPAMMMQANLLRTRGELDQARGILESLEKLGPDDPGVLFNLAGLWMQYRNYERARSYANRINPADTTPEFQRLVAQLKAALLQSELITELPHIDDIADGYREEAEEKPISLTVTLSAALRQIPVQWLNAATAIYHLPAAKRRPEREKALAAALKDPALLRSALKAESDDVRDALRYLAEAGGWCKLQTMTRRFGLQDGDGYFWDEEPPTSVIGRLRLLGLVYVGRTIIDGKRHKAAVIPADLRGVIDQIR